MKEGFDNTQVVDIMVTSKLLKVWKDTRVRT